MPNLPGGFELIVILLIVLLLFGGKKLPEMMRSLGKSSGEFKKGLAEGAEGDSKQDEDAKTKAEPPADNKTE